MTRIRLPLILAAALAGACLSPAMAQDVPQVLPYQGYIVDDASGEPASGPLMVTFHLYESGDAPSPLWSEEWELTPDNGVFYVYLGMMEPIADVIDRVDGLYLGVEIEGEGEASPRQRIGSVPYARVAQGAQWAETLGGYTAEDFVRDADLSGYARWDELGGRGYTTEQWVRQWVGDQGYITADDIPDPEGYATEDWVREWVGEQGYAGEDWVRQWVGDQGYATEQWVRDQGYVSQAWVDEQGYVGADALADYASQQWVRDYVSEQGYLRGDALEGYATEQWVRDQGYATEGDVLGYVADQGYATEAYVQSYVSDQGYATEGWVEGYVSDQGYLGADALDGYASEQWVRDQGYLTADAAAGFATEQWVRDQGYLTGEQLDARDYVDADALVAYGAELAGTYVSNADLAGRGYATEQWVRDQGYITGVDLDDRDYANRAYVDTLREDVGRTYVTTNALDARNYATGAQVTALSDRIDELEAVIDQLIQNRVAYLLGRSNQTSNGRFVFGDDTGIQAANAMCQTSYPNDPTAHFCSPDEVFRAVAAGSYSANAEAAADGVWTWAVTQESQTSRGGNSLHGNCQNLMYNSNDASNGTRMRVDFGYTSAGGGGNLTGDVVQIQQERNCGELYSVLCCR